MKSTVKTKRSVNKWKELVLKELAVSHIYKSSVHDNNPTQALQDLIRFYIQEHDYFERDYNRWENKLERFIYKIYDKFRGLWW